MLQPTDSFNSKFLPSDRHSQSFREVSSAIFGDAKAAAFGLSGASVVLCERDDTVLFE